MLRVLVINSACMRDAVQGFPAVSDIVRAHSGAHVHWAATVDLASVPLLHGGVERVIDIGQGALRAAPSTDVERYDVVLDLQADVTSALICARTRGRKVAHRPRLVPLRWFYNETHAFERDLSGVERNRALAAKALGHAVEGAPNFGIRAHQERIAREDWFSSARGRPYAIFLTAAQQEGLTWPEHQWSKLAAYIGTRGWQVFLHGNGDASWDHGAHCIVPPPMGLDHLAPLLSSAGLAVGLDGGYTHLAAACGAPTIALHAADSSARIDVQGLGNIINLGAKGCLPPFSTVLDAVKRLALPN